MRLIYYLIILLFIILLFFGIAIKTENPVEISVETPSQIVGIGKEFTVNISIDPVANPISGAQFSLVFDSSLASIRNISEGQIFNINGAKTLFNPGVLNNSTGNLVNVWGLIITPGASVNEKNNLAVITFNSSNAGIFRLNLTNVIVCNPESTSLPATISNISLNIMNDSILPPIRFINGTVMDSITKTGINGVNVSTNTSLSTTANATGFYSFAVTEGTYNLTATFGITYYTNSTTVSNLGKAVVVQDIELLKKPAGTITGRITNT